MNPQRRPAEAVQLAVDLVVFTVRDARLQVLVVERGNEPFKGRWALPGGFLRPNETLARAAERELVEETGLKASRLHLEQLQTYGDPGRDPRGRIVSVAYLAIAANLPAPTPGSDAVRARWQPVEEAVGDLPGMAFDHREIVTDGLERARKKLEETTLATVFCADEFTISELRHVYEVVWGTPIDQRNFSRKVLGTTDFVVPTGERRVSMGRPATLYQAGPANVLSPPMLRGSTE
jgi:8-oxo-dGTP diphosphatase